MVTPKVERPFRQLSILDDVDRVLAESSRRPIVIFKHSQTCGVSAEAYDELESLGAGPPFSADVYLVDVRAGRPVSNAIADRLRVRHESPQALLVHDGHVRWSASHFRVTADALRAALAGLGARNSAADTTRPTTSAMGGWIRAHAGSGRGGD